jgi:NTE family protein
MFTNSTEISIANNRIGLALSGGGTKGIAHAGVLKFLEEKNIQPTILAGASAGSIVACLYAIGKSPEDILEFFKSVYFFKWNHIVFNRPGFINSEAFKKYFLPIFGDTKIKDFKIEVNIVSTDLVSGETHVFEENTKVIDAIIASSAFPGITTPYSLDEILYSDGGILNNFPVDVIKNKCDKMIGIYVSPQQILTRNQLNSIRAITVRSFDLLSHKIEQPKFDYCDWFICPQKLSGYGTFETKKNKMDEIFEIGYEEAKNTYREGIV